MANHLEQLNARLLVDTCSNANWPRQPVMDRLPDSVTSSLDVPVTA
jgi:hypothetical protein